MAKGSPLNSLTKDDSMIYDTERVTIFSKFLAEEWDLDYLALYLNNRDLLQRYFNVKFHQLTVQGVKAAEDPFDYPDKLRGILLSQQRINDEFAPKNSMRPLQADVPALPPVPDSAHPLSPAVGSAKGNRYLEDTTPLKRSKSQGSYLGGLAHGQDGGSSQRRKRLTLKPLYVTETTEKIVPVALPPSLYFVPDAGLPETPSLAFHKSSLPVCCEVCLPRCHSKLRKFLGNRVTLGVKRRLEAVAPIIPEEHELNIDTEKLLIPISVFLYVICEEWRSMPVELREKFGSVGQAAMSLEKLNDVYSQSCFAQKERLEEIKHTEVLLSQCKSILITLEKKIRRLERRWKESRNHATNEELEALQDLRVKVSEETARRLSLDSSLKGMKRRHKKELARVESLWEDALKGEELPTAVKFSMSLRTKRVENPHKPVEAPVPVVDFTTQNPATWRDDISDFFIRAISYNVERAAIIEADKVRKEEEIKSISSSSLISISDTSEENSMSKEERFIHSEMALHEYIAMVKNQAVDLAAICVHSPFYEIHTKFTKTGAAVAPAIERSPEVSSLQRSLARAVSERYHAKKLVADVFAVAEGSALDVLDVKRKTAQLCSDEVTSRDEASRVELLADHAASVIERRLILSEIIENIHMESVGEMTRRSNQIAEDYVEMVIEDLVSALVPVEIKNQVETVTNNAQEQIEHSICDELCGALLTTAVSKHLENICTVATFEVLDTASSDLLEASALQIASEDKDREKKKMLLYVINGIITKIEREMENYDPKWSSLLDEPRRFLTNEKLDEVEAFRTKSVLKRNLVLIRNGFAGFKRIMVIKKVKALGNRIYYRMLWVKWHNLYKQERLMLTAIIRMQAVARVLCRKRKFATMRVHERRIQRLVDAYLETRNNKNKRDALNYMNWTVKRRKHLLGLCHGVMKYRLYRNYSYWHDKYKRVTSHLRVQASATIIQCAGRIYLAKVIVFHRRFARVITCAARVYLNRQRAYARKAYVLRCSDIVALKRMRYEWHVQNVRFRAWWLLSSRSRGMLLACRTWNTHKSRKGFNKLWAEVLAFREKQQRAATLINAVARRFVDQRQVLHYNRFSRGLRRMQAKVRGLMARKEFEVLLYLHACATKVQKIFRGWKTREDMMNSRIRDLHYGAMTNNYEKVMHYYEKYPELMVSLDADGNNLLHSAARGAAKRTLRLILKTDRLELNTLNYNGYSPLHMLITSTAVDRDQLFDYMTEYGFDEFQNTADGKTCLLLATEFSRLFIGQILIEDGVDGALADNSGLTCLQAACMNGLPKSYLGRLINYANCDAHCPGQNGRFPLHDAADEGTLDNVNFLLWRGVDINARGIQNGETSLMLACKKGHMDIVKFLLLQGCDATMSDYVGQNIAHYGVHANNVAIIDLIREADVEIDQVDNNGNTPLHIAAEVGASEAVKSLLTLGALPSVQNYVGDQPTHCAARGNHVNCLKELMVYEQYIGRMNYAHQTPLGMAKFHSAREAQAFLEHNYIFFLDEAERNEHGDIWWDKPIDEAVAEWKLTISPLGKRTFHNINTGEISDLPPSMETEWISHFAQDAKLPLTQKVHLKPEVVDFSAHQYLLDQDEEKRRVKEARAIYRTATVIAKWARRKLVYNLVRKTKHNLKLMANFSRWIWRVQCKLKRWRKARKMRCAIIIQRRWRGHTCRSWLYYSGEHYRLWYNRAGRYLKQICWRAWKNHLVWRLGMKLLIVAKAPQRIDEWQFVLDDAGMALRKFGLFEEYGYPGSHNLVKFYRNTFNGQFSFHQPSSWAKRDKQELIDARFLRVNGFIPSHARAATMFQALWRGFVARKRFALILKAARIATDAEDNYLNNPDDDKALFNYALYCHAFKLDYDRARLTYQEAMSRMEHAGPDIAQILYAYAIFCLVSYYQDERECLELIKRAKKAEETAEITTRLRLGIEKSVAIENGTYTHGTIFNTADVGFFRRAATHMQDSENWHNYAVSRWLVYDDFVGSFDAFMNAFTTNPTEIRLRANFDLMMTYFHGLDKEYKTQIIQQRNMATAQRECDLENERLEFAALRFQKNKAALLIQVYTFRIIIKIYHDFDVYVLFMLQRFCRHHVNRKKQGSPRNRGIGVGGVNLAYFL